MHKRFPPSAIKMSYTTLVLLLMCLGASHSVHLTKEIVLTPIPQPVQVSQFSNIISHLLQPSEAIVRNLATLLTSTTEPKVPEILDAVNSGLGLKLFIIVDDAVQIDSVEFETALFKGARDVSQRLYPNDFIKQIATYNVIQNKALQISAEVQDTIAETRIPVRRFEEVLESRHFLMKRDIHKRDLFSDLFDSIIENIQSAICNTIVSEVKTLINSTLTNCITTLQSIDVESSGDPLSTILSVVVEIGIFFTEQGLNCSDQWLENYAGGICTSFLNSSSQTTSDTAVRKRRDANETLSSVLQKNIFTSVFGGVTGILWSLISTVVNPLLKWAISICLSILENVLDNVIDDMF